MRAEGDEVRRGPVFGTRAGTFLRKFGPYKAFVPEMRTAG